MPVVDKLPKGSSFFAGSNDRAGRWYPRPEFRVPGSFCVRAPSRGFPRSYLTHFYSGKYAALLKNHRPDLYDALIAISAYQRATAVYQTDYGRRLLRERGVDI